MPKLNLENIKETVQLFSPTQCDFLTENCIVAFEKNNHSTGCKLSVTGDNNTTFEIEWFKKVNIAGYKEDKK
jgi:hypothetical protein